LKGFESLATFEEKPSQATGEGRKSLLGSTVKSIPKEIVIVLGIIVAMRYLVRTESFHPEQIRGFLHGLGIIAPMAFISLCALTVPLFLPPPLFIGLGAISFGQTTGAFYSVLGMTAGACLAFLLGRYLITDLPERFRKGRFKKLDEWMGRGNQLACMFSLRLIFFINPMVNYVSSATGITLRDYTLGTFFGLIPRTFMIAYFFEVFTRHFSVRDVLTDPLVLAFLMLPIAGGLLLMALTRTRTL